VKKLTAWLARLPRTLRWILVTVIGGTFLLLGLIMLVTPGPGIVFIFLGVSVLALEIEWARELHKQGMQGLERIFRKVKERFGSKP
jgi:uncharacterized protein (TIGR02611 family)